MPTSTATALRPSLQQNDAVSPECPQIEKPEGDIPFELGIDDVVVGDGDEATAGK